MNGLKTLPASELLRELKALDHFHRGEEALSGDLFLEGYLDFGVEEVPLLRLSVRDAERVTKATWEEAGQFLVERGYPLALILFQEGEETYRLSLARAVYRGTRKPLLSDYRRSYLLHRRSRPNKTFHQRFPLILQAEDLEGLEKAFDLVEVTEAFYWEFVRSVYPTLIRGVRGLAEEGAKGDFVLGFVARILFLGFVARRGWLGDEDFFKNLLEAYRKAGLWGQDRFYRDWLRPLFFQALKAPRGRKALRLPGEMPPWAVEVYREAPFLNGDLFSPKEDLDEEGVYLTDEAVRALFDFLFAYNFTVEENTRYEETLEVNPEFLGLILERLVNAHGVEGLKEELGAHYTPRVEVDLMVRLALAEWLHRKGLPLEGAYRLLHPSGDVEGLSRDEREKAKALLLSCKILDPAVGSGAFLMGALHVLEDALERLGESRSLSLRERLIANLHGVDPLGWAVWMTELRLWLAYFVELPDEARRSQAPLLPSLALNVRKGDSLLQRVGDRFLPVRLSLNDRTLKAERVKRTYDAFIQAREGYYKNRGFTVADVRQRTLAFLEAYLHELLLAGRTRALFDGGEPQEGEKVYEELVGALRAGQGPFLYLLDFAEVTVARGGFDVILANPPYVRQEEIADPLRGIEGKAYKDLLLARAKHDMKAFPVYKWAPDSVPTPSGRSDLYTFFFVRAMTLLKEDGVAAFVTSNSWLDVKYGEWLKKVFVDGVPLRYVIENGAKRSFRADVNTAMAIFFSPSPVRPQEPPFFVAARRPFEEVDLMEELREARAEWERRKEERA